MQLPGTEARGGAPGVAVASYYDDHKPRTPPPDLPSLLLDSRITYLGMPVRLFSASCRACHRAPAECCAKHCALIASSACWAKYHLCSTQVCFFRVLLLSMLWRIGRQASDHDKLLAVFVSSSAALRRFA